MNVEDLQLVGHALAGATALKKAHPGVIFTSGRREVSDQARAMAQNVIRNRRWIEQTYRATAESASLQAWVNRHPNASQGEIQAGLANIMTAWTDEQKGRLSRHFSGQAWDVQPMAPGREATAVKAFIRALPGLNKFLEKEGGLLRWHAQFN